MRRGARPVPRLEFSIGKGGLCRAWESIEGVQMPHSSTRICFGEEKSRPRGTPGSRTSVRHIPIEEPLSFIARPRQNKRAAPTQHHRKNFGKISRCCSASLSGFVTAAAITAGGQPPSFRSEKAPLPSSYAKRHNQFGKNTVEPDDCRYLLRPWPSAAFAVASNTLSSLSLMSLRKRGIRRNDWRKKRSAA